jgi:hypothetical protein
VLNLQVIEGIFGAAFYDDPLHVSLHRQSLHLLNSFSLLRKLFVLLISMQLVPSTCAVALGRSSSTWTDCYLFPAACCAADQPPQ